MKILILGGTVFLGRHTVEAALARGHEVTLFHRGKHNPGLFPDVETLHGDRDGDLAPLRGRQWDAVVDTCGYVPRVVRKSAELLADAVGHYTFISSVSVYPLPMPFHADESTPVATVDDPTTEDIGEYYGALKALCEQVVESYFPERFVNVRAGLIIGPYDYIDRFPYWVWRIAQGGDVLAPGRSERPVQCIDARDIADWNVRLIENGVSGTFNVTGPDTPLTMGDMLETVRQAAGSDAQLTWVSEDFLTNHEVGMFNEMPFWVTEAMNGLLEVDIRKALNTGLTFRPLENTARDVLAWLRERDPNELKWGGAMDGRSMSVGMSPERETELLRAWREASGAPPPDARA